MRPPRAAAGAERRARPALRKLAGGVAVGLLAGALALALDGAGLLAPIEAKTLDWRQRLAAREEAAGEAGAVELIYQGEASLEAARRPENQWGWPWPRSIWRPALDLLKREGARAAAFDIVFSERSAAEGDDEELAEGMKGFGPVFLATAFHEKPAAPLPEGALERVRALAVTVTADDPSLLEVFSEAASIHSLSIEPFLRAARGIGNVEERPDPDGIFRRLAPLVRFEGRLYPTLSLAVAHAVLGGGPIRLTRERELVFGPAGAERRIPLERDGTILIRFGRDVRQAHERAVEAFDAVMAGAEAEPAPKGTYVPGIFGGKIVFIGYAATGTYDLKPNPLMAIAPAVLVHVAASDNLLEGRSLRTWTRRSRAPLLAAILAIGAATGALVASTPSVARQLAFALATGALWFAAAVGLAFPRGLVLGVVAPESAVLFGLMGGSLFNYVTEGRQRRMIKDAFQHYLNPTFVEELLRDPSKLQLGGERREVTIFFSDLAGFTTLSERLSAEDLVKLLNAYLTRMTQIILRLGGTHDKYIGDAIMCFFGAPVPVARHATLACLSALEQQAEIARLNAEWAAGGLPTVHARMGINTGEVVVGNMGSEQTMDYTVMGDSVNLASRLEGANKPFGTLIMCGERTEELARDEIDFRELAGLKVKGKTRPVKVFEILGRRGETPPERLALARRFAEALRLYEARRFAEAAGVFDDLAKAGGDPPSRLYAEDCRRLLEEPPGPDWDGVVTLTTK